MTSSLLETRHENSTEHPASFHDLHLSLSTTESSWSPRVSVEEKILEKIPSLPEALIGPYLDLLKNHGSVFMCVPVPAGL